MTNKQIAFNAIQRAAAQHGMPMSIPEHRMQGDDGVYFLRVDGRVLGIGYEVTE